MAKKKHTFDLLSTINTVKNEVNQTWIKCENMFLEEKLFFITMLSSEVLRIPKESCFLA